MFLTRHATGDWGDLDDEDRSLNNAALIDGSRILSAYMTSKAQKIWIITEAADDDGETGLFDAAFTCGVLISNTQSARLKLTPPRQM